MFFLVHFVFCCASQRLSSQLIVYSGLMADTAVARNLQRILSFYSHFCDKELTSCAVRLVTVFIPPDELSHFSVKNDNTFLMGGAFS